MRASAKLNVFVCVTAVFGLTLGATVMTPVLAQVVTNGCAGGDFGDECSLFELTEDDANYIQVDDTRFGYFNKNDFGNPDLDTHLIRVIERAESVNQPGLRFIPIPGTFRRDASDQAGFPAGMLMNFVAETAPGVTPIDYTAMSLSAEFNIDFDTGSNSPNFRGAA